MDDATLILLLAPVALLDLAGKIWALVTLWRAPRSRGSRIGWTLAILLVNLFGWLAFLIFGRDDQ